MRRLIVTVLTASLVGLGPASVSVVQAQATGSIYGTASAANQTPLVNHTVRLRNVDTGQLVDSTTTNAAGEFSFTGLSPAKYVIEVVDAAGTVLIVSATMPLTVGVTISGVALIASATRRQVLAAAAGGLGALFTSTAGLVLLAGTGAGITAAVVATKERIP